MEREDYCRYQILTLEEFRKQLREAMEYIKKNEKDGNLANNHKVLAAIKMLDRLADDCSLTEDSNEYKIKIDLLGLVVEIRDRLSALYVRLSQRYVEKTDPWGDEESPRETRKRRAQQREEKREQRRELARERRRRRKPPKNQLRSGFGAGRRPTFHPAGMR